MKSISSIKMVTTRSGLLKGGASTNESPNDLFSYSPMQIDQPPPPGPNNLDTPASPESDGTEHEDIDPDGDLVLHLSDKSSVRVSSSILSQASATLSATVNRWFSRRFPRDGNAANPLIIDMGDPWAMYRLPCLLHNRPDPESREWLFDVRDEDLQHAVIRHAENLYQFAIVVERHQCHDAVRLVAEALLSDFAFPSARDATRLKAALQVVTAAYLLQQPRYFQLFTKRLATDYAVEWTGGYSRVKFQPGIPVKEILLIQTELARQSDEAIQHLNNMMGRYTHGRCAQHTDACARPPPKDNLVVRRITESIDVPEKLRPPTWCSGVSLRYTLTRLYRLERIQHVLWCAHHQERA